MGLIILITGKSKSRITLLQGKKDRRVLIAVKLANCGDETPVLPDEGNPYRGAYRFQWW